MDKDEAEKKWDESLKHYTRANPMPEPVKEGKCELCDQLLRTILDAQFHMREVHQIQDEDFRFKTEGE